jgi:hypothetical protein
MDNTPIILSENDISALKGKHGVVLFYMNGCNPCNMIKPHWNNAITDLKQEIGEEMILGAIEQGAMDGFNKHINVSSHVNGFPTILYLHPSNHNSPEVYTGNRDHSSIKQWIVEKKNRNSGVKKHNKYKHTHKNTHIEKKISNNNGYQGGGGRGSGKRRSKSRRRGTKRHYGSRLRIHRRRKGMRTTTRRSKRRQSGGGCGCGINIFGTPTQKTKQQKQ